MKNQSVCKWGYKNSISHSDYPYKLNNSNKVGSLYNKTTDVFSKNPNVLSKTHDYFYRIGDFYSSYETQNGGVIDVSYNINYYDNQTLSIETEKMTENYFDIDKWQIGQPIMLNYNTNDLINRGPIDPINGDLTNVDVGMDKIMALLNPK